MLRAIKRVLSATFVLAFLFFLITECDISFSGNVDTDAAVSYTLVDESTGRLSVFGRTYRVDHTALSVIGKEAGNLVHGLSETLSGGMRSACSQVGTALSALVKKFEETLSS